MPSEAELGFADAVTAFLAAVQAGDATGAMEAVRARPEIETASVHVAAVLGRESDVRRLVSTDTSAVASPAGDPPSEPLLWLCYSPFHGESPERDAGLAASAKGLLETGADPNTRDPQHGIPALYAVTGHRSVPRIARILLEAGANPTDGESVFHAAERFHGEALELLLRFGVDVNGNGDWGNTPLYFLLLHWDIEHEEKVEKGLLWLLANDADPNVRSGPERETALHVAVRRGQAPRIVRLLLDHGADLTARRADGRTPWVLAERGGFGDLSHLLEEAGALPEPLSAPDALLAACGRGELEEARRRATPEVLAALPPTDLALMVEAARRGRLQTVRGFLAAGFPVDTRDDIGATALHNASIAGHAPIVRELLRRGADVHIRDEQHEATPLDWACFGADFIARVAGDYEGCVRGLLEAGARPAPGDHWPAHEGVKAVLEEYLPG